jgi:predicted metal-dependent hydrolase
VHAPEATSFDVLTAALRNRQPWVYEKLIGKGLNRRGEREMRFSPGETHYHLGRTYRLKYLAGAQPGVTLTAGWFVLPNDQRAEAHDLFVDWYIAHGRSWLEHRVERFRGRIGVPECKLEVRELGYRWGSCGASGLNFHWRVMLLPPSIIDYVIVHELAHILEPHHTTDYWARVRRAMPDYELRELWLTENGAKY